MWARWFGSILVFGSCFPLVLAASDSPLIQTLQIRGTRRVVEIETRAGEPFDEARIDRDVHRLWATGWFDDIRVESSQSAGGVQLIFTLVERSRLYLRRIEFKPARERLKPNLQKGEAVDPVLAKKVAAELRRQLVEQGFADARVEAKIKPVGLRQADLDLRVERGRAYQVREVRFSGPLGIRAKELQGALRFTRPKRLLPGLGRLWHGWWLHQPFSEQRVQADLERLRSLYFSGGYFDARVEIGALTIKDGKATVTFDVDSGRHYNLQHLEVVGAGPTKQILPQPDGAFSAKKLCQCLLEARREAEKRGALDFSAELQLKPVPARAWVLPGIKPADQQSPDRRAVGSPSAELTATLKTGPAYRIGRIEFSGHHAVSDTTLRRALLLREGDLFDQERLRRSLARLNRFGFLEPVTTSDVHTELAPDDHRADLKIRVKENRGRWSLWGPLGPASVSGPPGFMIGVRLPPLGQGPAELSTYYATFSLLASPWPWVSVLASAPRVRWQTLVAFERPYLPGQSWQSGFLLTPQLGWGTLAGYGLTRALQAVQITAGQDSARPSGISVPASWRTIEREDDQANIGATGVLNCEEPKPSWMWLRTAGSEATNVAARWFLPAMLRH